MDDLFRSRNALLGARYLLALVRGEESPEAFAGAAIVASFMLSQIPAPGSRGR